MRNKKTNKKKLKFDINGMLLVLALTTIMATIVTLSRYKSTMASTNNQAQVGKPIVQTTIEEIELNSMKPGDIKEYSFVVKNDENSEITDTEMVYTIGVNTGSFLPLNVELYFAPNGIVQGTNLLNSNNITQERELEINSQETHSYLLKITWGNLQNNYKYSDEIDSVQIIVNSYQKNPI